MIMPSECISNLARSRPRDVSPGSLDSGLPGHLQTRLITASKVRTIVVFEVDISKLTRSRPPTVSPNLLDYGLQIHTIMASKCISTLAPSRNASVSSIDHGLPGYLQIRSVTPSKYIPKLARSWPQCASLNSLDLHFQVHIKFSLKHRAYSPSYYTV